MKKKKIFRLFEAISLQIFSDSEEKMYFLLRTLRLLRGFSKSQWELLKATNAHITD